MIRVQLGDSSDLKSIAMTRDAFIHSFIPVDQAHLIVNDSTDRRLIVVHRVAQMSQPGMVGASGACSNSV